MTIERLSANHETETFRWIKVYEVSGISDAGIESIMRDITVFQGWDTRLIREGRVVKSIKSVGQYEIYKNYKQASEEVI